MKNIALYLFAIVTLTIAGCKKDYPGDTYNFTDSKAAYVEFSPKTAKTVVQGTTFTTVVQMRTALTEDVSVNYAITGTTATITGTIIIPRNTVKVTGSITLPNGIVAPGTVVQGQLKLVSALKGTDVLRIGFNGASTEVIALTIKP
jgi:hypothetical protein